MPIFKVSGFEKSSARNVTWYIHAKSANMAEAHAVRGGLVDAEMTEVDPAAVPPDVTVIPADTAPRRATDDKPSLIWRIAIGVLIGNLGAAAILKLLGYLG